MLRKGPHVLCGMLASDFATSPPMKDAVKRFFDANERWVARVLDEGRKAHALKLAGAAPELARTLVAALEGAMLVARSYGEVSRFEVRERLVAQLVGRQRT